MTSKLAPPDSVVEDARTSLELDLRRSARLHEFGRLAAEAEVANSKSIIDRFDLAGLGDVAPVRALVVAGLPRTGTTFLHRLLVRSIGLRALAAWEAQQPLSHEERSVRRAKEETRDRYALAEELAPRLQMLHPLDAAAPDECTPLLQNSFDCLQWAIMFHVPAYVEWLLESDGDVAYRLWAAQLARIDPAADGWVLKSAVHGPHYAALGSHLTSDSTVVQLRRDPVAFMVSSLNLIESARSLFSDDVDPVRLGAEWIEIWPRVCERAERGAAHLPSLIRVDANELRRDPDGVVDRVGERLSPSLRRTPGTQVGTRWRPLPARSSSLRPLAHFGLRDERVRRALTPYESMFTNGDE